MTQLEGKVVQTLVGNDRDEITSLVMRLKKADERSRQPFHTAGAALPAEDIKWAEDWQLPREVFDYFTLDRDAQ